MNGVKGIASLSRRLYIVTIEFVIGEHSHIFNKAFYADNEEDLEQQIQGYLTDYYGVHGRQALRTSDPEDRTSDITVRRLIWEEVTRNEQLYPLVFFNS